MSLDVGRSQSPGHGEGSIHVSCVGAAPLLLGAAG